MNLFLRLTGRLSQGQPDPDQSKKFMLMCLFLFLIWQNKRPTQRTQPLDGRNRAIVIAESLARVIAPPCPTYQLQPFSSAKENHPKMPIWGPQNEFPGIPWIW